MGGLTSYLRFFLKVGFGRVRQTSYVIIHNRTCGTLKTFVYCNRSKIFESRKTLCFLDIIRENSP